MIQTQFFIGIDVSKPYFDASLLAIIDHFKNDPVHQRFDNTLAGIKVFYRWLKSNKVSFDQNTLVVMENTGIYHRLLWSFCSKNNLPLHIGNAAHIKWSFGITRGKNDKIDSVRLCKYAYKEAEALKATPTLNPVLMQLKDLMTARTRLLSQINSLRTYIGELRDVSEKGTQKKLEEAHQAAIKGIALSIKSLEEEISKIIMHNKAIKGNYDLLITVPGIGHLTAIYLICCTNNFIGKISGKQLACYAGVVPFEHSSGISIKGRKKVHPMANKELKKMLHLCALTAVKNYSEFKQYYNRKKQEGKHGRSILNAIRNKIVLRAVAVVNKQEAYVSNFKSAA
jgi:transposase